jgi:hypothetical protein
MNFIFYIFNFTFKRKHRVGFKPMGEKTWGMMPLTTIFAGGKFLQVIRIIREDFEAVDY